VQGCSSLVSSSYQDVGQLGTIMRDYGKVHTSFWTSDTTRSMTEDGRALSLYLLTCPHTTMTGVFRLPDGYVCEDIQWGNERVAKGFIELLQKGFANRCETTKWVWIFKHLEWNAPENPNQKKNAIKIALSVPDECSWKQEFMRSFANEMDLDIEQLLNPSKTLSKPETGTGAVTGENTYVHSDAVDDCPHQEIIALYHKHLPMLTQVRTWTDKRAKALKARWREDKKRQSLEFWEKLFRYIAESDFLTGKASDWQADLEWIINPSNLVKIIEGKYENKP
jgi:hypothetical protein